MVKSFQSWAFNEVQYAQWCAMEIQCFLHKRCISIVHRCTVDKIALTSLEYIWNCILSFLQIFSYSYFFLSLCMEKISCTWEKTLCLKRKVFQLPQFNQDFQNLVRIWNIPEQTLRFDFLKNLNRYAFKYKELNG